MSFIQPYGKGNTGALDIRKTSNNEIRWCDNNHRTGSGQRRQAQFKISICGYEPICLCKDCAKEAVGVWCSVLGIVDEVKQAA